MKRQILIVVCFVFQLSFLCGNAMGEIKKPSCEELESSGWDQHAEDPTRLDALDNALAYCFGKPLREWKDRDFKTFSQVYLQCRTEVYEDYVKRGWKLPPHFSKKDFLKEAERFVNSLKEKQKIMLNKEASFMEMARQVHKSGGPPEDFLCAKYSTYSEERRERIIDLYGSLCGEKKWTNEGNFWILTQKMIDRNHDMNYEIKFKFYSTKNKYGFIILDKLYLNGLDRSGSITIWTMIGVLCERYNIMRDMEPK